VIEHSPQCRNRPESSANAGQNSVRRLSLNRKRLPAWIVKLKIRPDLYQLPNKLLVGRAGLRQDRQAGKVNCSARDPTRLAGWDRNGNVGITVKVRFLSLLADRPTGRALTPCGGSPLQSTTEISP
jgi:hypothetical protein